MKTKILQKTFVAIILVLASGLLLGISQSRSQSVQEAWVARYNGPANLDDGGHAIAGDNSGNVYVTGGSHGLGTDLDYNGLPASRQVTEPGPLPLTVQTMSM